MTTILHLVFYYLFNEDTTEQSTVHPFKHILHLQEFAADDLLPMNNVTLSVDDVWT